MSEDAGQCHVRKCGHCDSGGGVFHGYPGKWLYLLVLFISRILIITSSQIFGVCLSCCLARSVQVEHMDF